MQDMLVDAFVSLLSDPGSSPGASTKQPGTRFLSSESAGDMNPGAFVVLRVGFVLKVDVWDFCLPSVLWT